MVIVQILKRKDGSSVVVAVVLAMVIVQTLAVMSSELASRISNFGSSAYTAPVNWKFVLVQPLVAAVLQIALLEVLAWLYVWSASALKVKK